MLVLPDGLTVYWSPGDDVQAAILDLLNSAKSTVRVMMYALTSVPIVDALIGKHAAGVDVKLVLDQSQAGASPPARLTGLEEVALGGSPELPQLLRLKSAGVPYVIGVSPAGGIIHSKYCVVDGTTVLCGSYNWSQSAALQCNTTYVEVNPDLATAFLADWQANWARLGGT